MPKNSRPDIQVLEDRIVRLKAQLLEYKELRLYSATKRRLSTVADELAECIAVIDEIVTADTNNISISSLSAIDEAGLGISEFSEDSDLLDTFLLNTSIHDSSFDHYSAKEIVSTYSTRIKNVYQEHGQCTGIIQVNQFCQLLNSWYQNRFTPVKRNPNFYFKSDKIHEWIDLLILAAGKALHQELYAGFLSDMNIWITNLNTSKDDAWALPYSVVQIKEDITHAGTQEAVLFESMIKPFLYDDKFYGSELHSVKKIVMSSGRFTEDDLSIESIIQSCPKLIRSSSFDIAKYKEV